jgi:hypothetical protein
MLATWRSMVFPVFGHRAASLESTKNVGRLLEKHGRSLGHGKMVELTILDCNSPVPEADVRAAMDAMVPLVAPYYAGVAAIFEGDGFRAAMIRGILTGFQILSRNKYPQKVFGRPEECATWALPIARSTGVLVRDADEILAVIRSVKAEGVKRDILTPTVVQELARLG